MVREFNSPEMYEKDRGVMKAVAYSFAMKYGPKLLRGAFFTGLAALLIGSSKLSDAQTRTFMNSSNPNNAYETMHKSSSIMYLDEIYASWDQNRSTRLVAPQVAPAVSRQDADLYYLWPTMEESFR